MFAVHISKKITIRNPQNIKQIFAIVLYVNELCVLKSINMFQRIRTDRNQRPHLKYPQNDHLYSNLPRKQTSSKCQISYSQKYRKSKGAAKQADKQKASGGVITKSQNHIYQGQSKNGMKHGEGVLMTRGGMIILGQWLQDQLHGRAIIFTPFGGRLLASFNQGKLNGWTFAFFGERVIVCMLFYENKIDGEKLTYEDSEKMWVATRCAQDGKTIAISHVQKGTLKQLPTFVDSEELEILYNSYVKESQHFLALQNIDYMQVNNSLTFIGFTDSERRPHGLGVVYSKQQSYFGHYFEGTLQLYGRMIFSNGQIYQGGFQNGIFYSRGVYYKPAFNVTSFLESDEAQQSIIDERCGYVMIDIDPGLGMIAENRYIGIKGKTIQSVCSTIELYYLRHFVQKGGRRDDSIGSSNSQQYGRSEDMDEISPVLNGVSHRTQEQLPSSPYRKDEKWIKLGKPEQQPALQRRASLDKRQAYNLGRQNAQTRQNNYQTTQIRQNTRQQQRESYRRNSPKAIAIHQVQFEKNPYQENPKSLQAGEITLRDGSNQPFKRSNTQEPPYDNFQLDKSQKSSQISKSSQKLNRIFDNSRTNRKKIFN